MKPLIPKRVSTWVGVMLLVVIIGVSIFDLLFPPHDISLVGSDGRIRDAILKVTPLGMTRDQAKSIILGRLHPDTLFYYDDPSVLPGAWPLGGSNVKTQIGCQLGESGVFPLYFDDACAAWGFNSAGKLVDVFVWKVANAP